MQEWSKYGGGLKDIFRRNGVEWNSNKVENLGKDDLIEIFEKYKVDEYVGEYMVYMDKGKSGVWESSECAIKIVMIEGSDNVLLVFKKRVDSVGDIYKEFVKYCKKVGGLAQLIGSNGEVLFRDRINVELIKRLDDKAGERKVKIKNFVSKIELKFGDFSDKFKEDWVECIRRDYN